MTQKLNVATWLVVGAIAINTMIAPPSAQALIVEPTLEQANINISPIDAVGQYQQGLAAASAGEMQMAISQFDRAIKLDPKYLQAYIERGNVKNALSDFSGAIADYTTAITINPKSAAAHYNRGTVLSQSGKHQAAIADYRLAISIDSQYAQAHLNLANELDDLNDTNNALIHYDRAIMIRSNYALAYLNRGIMHERSGDRVKAIADLSQAAKLFQASGHVDRYNRAIKMIKELQSEQKKGLTAV